jgi:hypothetical protein
MGQQLPVSFMLIPPLEPPNTTPHHTCTNFFFYTFTVGAVRPGQQLPGSLHAHLGCQRRRCPVVYHCALTLYLTTVLYYCTSCSSRLPTSPVPCTFPLYFTTVLYYCTLLLYLNSQLYLNSHLGCQHCRCRAFERCTLLAPLSLSLSLSHSLTCHAEYRERTLYGCMSRVFLELVVLKLTKFIPPNAEYRERTLYGCMSREFGVIPPEAYPGYDYASGQTTTAIP